MRRSKLVDQHDYIVSRLRDGMSRRSIAADLDVPRSTVIDYVRNYVTPETVAAGDNLSSETDGRFIEIPTFERTYDAEEHYVYPLGDLHIGSEAFADDRWQEWIGYLNERKVASLLGTGDFLNSALKTSVSETYDEIMNVGTAKRKFRDDLTKLAAQDRIDLLMPGNHEARIYRAVGDCPIQDVADYHKTNYARDACVIIYNIGNQRYEFYVRHGTGGGQVGARANRLAKQAQTVIADVYVSGHTHSQLVFPQEVFWVNPDTNRVERRRQYFVSSGSFLQYESYASVQSFTPTKIGAPRIRLDGTRKDIHVSV